LLRRKVKQINFKTNQHSPEAPGTCVTGVGVMSSCLVLAGVLGYALGASPEVPDAPKSIAPPENSQAGQ
jgi:hypothetical protein